VSSDRERDRDVKPGDSLYVVTYLDVEPVVYRVFVETVAPKSFTLRHPQPGAHLARHDKKTIGGRYYRTPDEAVRAYESGARAEAFARRREAERREAEAGWAAAWLAGGERKIMERKDRSK
jgi:hypothetical protein